VAPSVAEFSEAAIQVKINALVKIMFESQQKKYENRRIFT